MSHNWAGMSSPHLAKQYYPRRTSRPPSTPAPVVATVTSSVLTPETAGRARPPAVTRKTTPPAIAAKKLPCKRGAPAAPRAVQKRSRDAGAETVTQAHPTSKKSVTILVSNRGRWASADSYGAVIPAEVLCTTHTHFIAVFDRADHGGVANAPLGVVCAPLSSLPANVKATVTARTTAADARIAKQKKLFKLTIGRGDFQPARYAPTRAGEDGRPVRVAIAGPLRGRPMTSGMEDVLVSRVSFLRRGQQYYFLLDDTLQTSGEDFSLTSSCFSSECVFAFAADGTPALAIGREASLVEWLVNRLNCSRTKWLKQKKDSRSVCGAPALIRLLQQAAIPPAQCGPLARRFFQSMGVDAFRGWRGNHDNRFELCETQTKSQDASEPHVRCCCGLLNFTNCRTFEPTGILCQNDDHVAAERRFYSRACCGERKASPGDKL